MSYLQRPADTFTTILLTLVLLTFLAKDPAAAESLQPSDPPVPTMSHAMLLSLIPGAGHAYLGDYPRAGGYAGASLSFLGAGFALDRSLRDYSYRDQNLAYQLAEKTYQLSIATTYLSARYSLLAPAKPAPNSPPSEHQLILAPFSPATLSDPWVHVGWIVASSVTALEALTRPATRYGDLTAIERGGHAFSTPAGTALYGTELATGSLITAPAEEAFWRGMIQQELQDNTGRWPGLLLASTLFGFAHTLAPGTSTEKTDRFLNGTLGGLYLGLLFDRHSHRLAPAIAAHFWYNIAVGATLFLVDPSNNPLRFRLDFTF